MKDSRRRLERAAAKSPADRRRWLDRLVAEWRVQDVIAEGWRLSGVLDHVDAWTKTGSRLGLSAPERACLLLWILSKGRKYGSFKWVSEGADRHARWELARLRLAAWLGHRGSRALLARLRDMGHRGTSPLSRLGPEIAWTLGPRTCAELAAGAVFSARDAVLASRAAARVDAGLLARLADDLADGLRLEAEFEEQDDPWPRPADNAAWWRERLARWRAADAHRERLKGAAEALLESISRSRPAVDWQGAAADALLGAFAGAIGAWRQGDRPACYHGAIKRAKSALAWCEEAGRARTDVRAAMLARVAPLLFA